MKITNENKQIVSAWTIHTEDGGYCTLTIVKGANADGDEYGTVLLAAERISGSYTWMVNNTPGKQPVFDFIATTASADYLARKIFPQSEQHAFSQEKTTAAIREHIDRVCDPRNLALLPDGLKEGGELDSEAVANLMDEAREVNEHTYLTSLSDEMETILKMEHENLWDWLVYAETGDYLRARDIYIPALQDLMRRSGA